MDEMALRTPSPGHTNSGNTSWDGSRWVSLTRRRMDSDTRSRRLRWTGKDMFPLSNVPVGRWRQPPRTVRPGALMWTLALQAWRPAVGRASLGLGVLHLRACSAVPNEIKALSAHIGRIYQFWPGKVYGVQRQSRWQAVWRTIENGTTVRTDWA